jgi:O-acetyl-ADP-ribose deacetylase (regulator of RNase III)
MRVSADLTAREALYAALISRPPRPFPAGFLDDLGRLLIFEAAARPRLAASGLPRTADRLALWRGDIASLEVDAIVNAANSALLGCFQPFHACIDNRIHAVAGPRLRADCQTIMAGRPPEPTGTAKITRAYHLPSRYVLHTVGPIFAGDPARVPPEQSDALASCYRACLDLASALPAIRSLAFCCISTGVFGFPAEAAAGVAIDTVSRWQDEHPGRLGLIVYSVFTERDERTYRTLLQRRIP